MPIDPLEDPYPNTDTIPPEQLPEAPNELVKAQMICLAIKFGAEVIKAEGWPDDEGQQTVDVTCKAIALGLAVLYTNRTMLLTRQAYALGLPDIDALMDYMLVKHFGEWNIPVRWLELWSPDGKLVREIWGEAQVAGVTYHPKESPWDLAILKEGPRNAGMMYFEPNPDGRYMESRIGRGTTWSYATAAELRAHARAYLFGAEIGEVVAIAAPLPNKGRLN